MNRSGDPGSDPAEAGPTPPDGGGRSPSADDPPPASRAARPASRDPRPPARRRLPRWPRTVAPAEAGATPPVGVELLGRGLAASGPRGPIFTRVDLDVPAGGLAVVHGPGGSGRSALLLALGGRFRLTAGELRVGEAVASDGLGPLRAASSVARVRPGIEPDEGLRIHDLEQVSALASAGRSGPERIAAAYALLEIDPVRDALLGDLHPLEALLVSVALAVSEHRPLVIVDDVEHGLTAADRAQAWRALDAVAEAGPTVLASALEPPDGLEHVAIALPHPSEHRRVVARPTPAGDDRPAAKPSGARPAAAADPAPEGRPPADGGDRDRDREEPA